MSQVKALLYLFIMFNQLVIPKKDIKWMYKLKKGWMCGGMCDIPHVIETKVPNSIDMFLKHRSLLVLDQTISTQVVRGSLQDC